MDNRNTRVLVVDDQESIYTDFQEMLGVKRRKNRADELAAGFLPATDDTNSVAELPSFELSYASNGDDAVEAVKSAKESNRPFALAYIDIRMPPGIDGIEAIRQIREFEKDLEIVIMTAYSDKPMSAIMTNLELLHKLLYIRKPVAREEIQQITRTLVEKWNLEQEASRQRQRLKTVLDANRDAIALFGEDNKLLHANRAYYQLFDISHTELKRLSPEDLSKHVAVRLREVGNYHTGVNDPSAHFEAIMEEKVNRSAAEPRLFYRFVTPLEQGSTENYGSIICYHDMSKEAEIQRMKAEITSLNQELTSSYSFDGIIGDSAGMRKIYEQIQLASESDIAVLIQGESGTGKELVAKAIHYNSSRRNKRFVTVNCAAMPESLIESELFGHEKGAFTGAAAQRIGKFEQANAGTIFLDNIGDMPKSSQAMLRRVLQDGRIQRVGGTGNVDLDFRVIAATNHDLEAEMKTGCFRKELYFRIAAFPITIPPLRERREDIPLLVNHFLQNTHNPPEHINAITPEALRMLMQYRFPGNVQELKNIVRRAVMLETSDILQASTLSLQITGASRSAGDDDSPPHPHNFPLLAELERIAIVQSLEVTGNNIARAAQELGINQSTLHRKMKVYGIER